MTEDVVADGDVQQPQTAPTQDESWWRRRSRAARIGMVVGGVLVVLLIALWIALPSIIAAIIRSKLPELEEQLGRKIQFDDVDVHGLSGIDINGIRIEDDQGETLLAIERVEMRMSGVPLFGDPELESIHLVAPAGHLKRDAEGVTNFDQLRKKLSERESNAEESPFKGNPVFRISGGSVTFEDALEETFNFESARALELTFTPSGEDGGQLEAEVEMTFHFKDAPTKRTEALHLEGTFSKTAGLSAEARFPQGLALPLDGSTLLPGVRLGAVRLGIEKETSSSDNTASAGGMGHIELQYDLAGMVLNQRYPLLGEGLWVEQVVFGRTPEPADVSADVAFLDDFVGPGIEPWTEGTPNSQPVVQDDLNPAMSQSESYFERYDFEFESPDGTEIDAELIVSNFGLGTHKGTVKGTLTRPGQDKVEFVERFSAGDWKLGDAGFSLTMGDWMAEGKPGAVKLSGVFKASEEGPAEDMSFELLFEGVSWKPGRGLTRFGDGERGGFIEDIVTAAGKATGTLSAAGQEINLSGTGYSHRVATNVGPSGLASRVYRFHEVEGSVFVEWKRVQTSDALGSVPVDYFVVSYDGKTIFESFDVEMVSEDPFKDPGNYGYVVHKRMDLTARDAQGRETKLSLAVDDIDIHNPLSALSPFQRSIAEKMAKPTTFNLASTWGLLLPAELGVPQQHRGNCKTSCFVMR